jgi:catechol 2,3-dioxygenase-like lactoylglutathione lyase family enzyme
MVSITSLLLEVADPAAASRFYADAFGEGVPLGFRASDATASGFRGFTISLTVAQPADVHALYDSAVAAGATVLKPVSKSLWGHGGTLRAPDGAIWNIATSAKKDAGPGVRAWEHVVLLLGADDVAASKRFYTERGLATGKSFGSYVEFELPGSPVGFGLYKRRALAKSAGVPEDGTGSHRLAILGDLGTATDPDGFAWEPADASAS